TARGTHATSPADPDRTTERPQRQRAARRPCTSRRARAASERRRAPRAARSTRTQAPSRGSRADPSLELLGVGEIARRLAHLPLRRPAQTQGGLQVGLFVLAARGVEELDVDADSSCGDDCRGAERLVLVPLPAADAALGRLDLSVGELAHLEGEVPTRHVRLEPRCLEMLTVPTHGRSVTGELSPVKSQPIEITRPLGLVSRHGCATKIESTFWFGSWPSGSACETPLMWESQLGGLEPISPSNDHGYAAMVVSVPRTS